MTTTESLPAAIEGMAAVTESLAAAIEGMAAVTEGMAATTVGTAGTADMAEGERGANRHMRSTPRIGAGG